MTDWLLPLAGGATLVLLGWDVFKTAFHAEGRGGPINRRQNRLIWGAVRALGVRGGPGGKGGRFRDGVLSYGGPIIALSTIAVWTVLLLGGFWLIYLPHVLDFHFTPGQPGSARLEALYYSGIIAATLGQGDVVARDGWMRAVTVVQGVGGFALVTVAVTYVLAVYRELVAAQTLAATIDAYLGTGPAGAGPGSDAAGGADAGMRSAVADVEWRQDMAGRLARVLESHFNYPILHYFRPRRPERAVPWQVARLAAWDGSGGAPDGDRLTAVIDRYALEVDTLFVRQRSVAGSEAHDRTTGERLDRILEMVALPTPA